MGHLAPGTSRGQAVTEVNLEGFRTGTSRGGLMQGELRELLRGAPERLMAEEQGRRLWLAPAGLEVWIVEA